MVVDVLVGPGVGTVLVVVFVLENLILLAPKIEVNIDKSFCSGTLCKTKVSAGRN